MTTHDQQRLRHQARVFKALGHATRLAVVRELGSGERCVAEIHELVEADLSTVSRHLAVLRDAGLVRDERRGNQVFYRLAAPCVLEFMDCVDTVIAGAQPFDLAASAPPRRSR
jgi:ArsR family transcriptional regulator